MVLGSRPLPCLIEVPGRLVQASNLLSFVSQPFAFPMCVSSILNCYMDDKVVRKDGHTTF